MHTPPTDSKLSETRMLQFQWGAHQLANKIFAGGLPERPRRGWPGATAVP
jgi:hypothetical protein